MGISKQVVKALVAENGYSPIAGEWLSFGRQTVNVDSDVLIDICGDLSIHGMALDTETRHGAGHRVSDRALLEGLFPIRYSTVDKSPYEGADMVMDLSDPIDLEFYESYDFVFTGGCLDNVFSPAELIRNSSRFLRVGGRVMHFESASRLLGAFSYPTAEWFLSYYAVNDFVDCKVYLLVQSAPGRNRFDYDLDVFSYSHEFSRSGRIDYFRSACAGPGIQYLLVIAEKGSQSSNDLTPDQLQYLDENSQDWRIRAKSYERSGRPLLTGPVDAVVDRPFLSDHYTYMGSGF